MIRNWQPNWYRLEMISLQRFATFQRTLPFVVALSCAQFVQGQLQNPARDLVDPFIGTGGHGHTFPGACVPNGMVQLSPDTRTDGVMDWDGCSGYHYSDSLIYGFSHTHLSGTGVADLCDVLLMPISGAEGDWFLRYGYRQRFDHEQEEAHAGYYKVQLKGTPQGAPESFRTSRTPVKAGKNERDIDVELTATARVGVHRYTYQPGQSAHVVLDLLHRDHVLAGSISTVNSTEVIGERRSSSWASDQRLYYCMRFSEPIMSEQVMPSNVAGKVAAFDFGMLNKPLIVKVGISAVSIEGARANLEAEVPHWDFDRVRQQAEGAWNDKLNKIQVKGGTPDEQTTFYTALYHTNVAPYIFNDVDGKYRGMDGEVHHADHNVYTVFSLWDTFRALHPLMTILEPDMTSDWIKTFLLHYQLSGRLPVWELWGNETDCMIGYHSVSVISDAYMKGIRGYDAELALEAMVASADADRFGLEHYRERGYISSEDEPESVSRTLEYAYDDWCIARMAEAMGKNDIATRFYDRSRNWQNVFDPETKFFRARRNGGFVSPFDPYEVNFHFTEANAWQYGLFVPHDMERYTELIGGKEALSNRLGALFSANSTTTGRDQSDITGLIGQYAHGNEPSHSFAYLNSLSSHPEVTDGYVKNILNNLYHNAPDGLSGNEDCGQMSAWYVLSAVGMYPICPGKPEMTLTMPLFDSIAVDLGNDRTLVISSEAQGGVRNLIERVEVNGKELTSDRTVPFELLRKGGKLHYQLGARQVSSFTDTKVHGETELSIWQPVPIISAGSQTFKDSLKITVSSSDIGARLYYSLNGSEPLLYSEPFHISANTSISAFAERIIPDRAGSPFHSMPAMAHFVKVDRKLSIELETDHAQQYSAGGDQALVDGLRGGDDYRTGEWQGFEGEDLIATIDLGKPMRLDRVGLSALQDQRSWIWLPADVQFAFSANGRQWSTSIATHTIARDTMEALTTELWTEPISKRARYIKVIARNAGPCPEWHPGNGGPSWIFADEVLIETK